VFFASRVSVLTAPSAVMTNSYGTSDLILKPVLVPQSCVTLPVWGMLSAGTFETVGSRRKRYGLNLGK